MKPIVLFLLMGLAPPWGKSSGADEMISPIVSYQFPDSLNSFGEGEIMSQVVSYQFLDSLNSFGQGEIMSQVVSFQYYDWPGDSVAETRSSAWVSYSLPETFTLTITGQNGTVVRVPDLPFYPRGSHVTVTAEPVEGFVFDRWEGDASATGQSLTLTMNRDIQVRAIFIKPVRLVLPTTFSAATPLKIVVEEGWLYLLQRSLDLINWSVERVARSRDEFQIDLGLNSGVAQQFTRVQAISEKAKQQPFLSFPIPGADPFHTSVSSIFDHENPNREYIADGKVRVCTGETWDASKHEIGITILARTVDGVEIPSKTIIGSADPKDSQTYFGDFSGKSGHPGLVFYKSSNQKINVPFQYGSDPRVFYDGHNGYDYPFPKGTPVVAAEDGFINASRTGQFGTAEVVIEGNSRTYYLHLSQWEPIVGTLKERPEKPEVIITGTLPNGELRGNWVSAGTKIGEVGDTGAKGAFHLHFSVEQGKEWKDPYGEIIAGQEIYPPMWIQKASQ